MESIKYMTIKNNKYLNIDLIGKGSNGQVYLIQEIDKQKQLFVIKILKQKDIKLLNYFNIITKIIKKITDLNNPNIIKMISYGRGNIKFSAEVEGDAGTAEGEEFNDRFYAIYEYASKGTLIDYFINLNKPYLEEKYVLIIFKNIAKGLQAMHNNNIYHRDIKLENILFDEKYTPKICDFGFIIQKSDKLFFKAGTPQYCAPEILVTKEELKKNGYFGEKADIYSLGITIMKLLVGYSTNISSNLDIKEEFNLLIKEKNLTISDEIKILVLKMISKNPKERPSINNILEYPLLKEFNENDINIKQEYFKEFENREAKIDNDIKKNYNITITNVINRISSKNKSGDSVYKEYIKKDFKLIIIDDNKIKIRDFIKINGDLNPLEFMNYIAFKIGKKFEEYIKSEEAFCNVKGSKKYYKFKVKIEYKKEEEEEDEDEEEGKEESEEEKQNEKDEEYPEELYTFKKFVKKEDLKIEVILLKSVNGYHLIRFYKKAGDIEDYYNKLEKIIEAIKKSLNA